MVRRAARRRACSSSNSTLSRSLSLAARGLADVTRTLVPARPPQARLSYSTAHLEWYLTIRDPKACTLGAVRRLARFGPSAVLVLLLVTVSACGSPAAWPRLVSTTDARGPRLPTGSWIADYDAALATITAVMRDDLSLPLGEATLVFYRDRGALAEALRGTGYTDQLAEETARTLVAIGGFRRVLLNDTVVSELPWAQRVGLLAHELSHTLQYEVGGGRRGASEQWLREGFAEWVRVEVLSELGFTTPSAARIAVRRLVRAAASRPSLGELVTFPEWVAVAQRIGTDALYAQALLAVDLLVETHGAPALVDYFRRFATSDDRHTHFRSAFGEELDAFARRFGAAVQP
jgi:hypothetical protein